MEELNELRLATRADAADIARMSRDLIEDGLGWSWRPERVAAMIRNREAVVLVARAGEELIGFAIMEFHDRHAHLNLLAVQPDHRRRGVGGALLGWLEKSARFAGIEELVLEVRARNRGARDFYERLGWETARYVSGYYRGRESAIRMIRRLAPVDAG